MLTPCRVGSSSFESPREAEMGLAPLSSCVYIPFLHMRFPASRCDASTASRGAEMFVSPTLRAVSGVYWVLLVMLSDQKGASDTQRAPGTVALTPV